MDNQSARLIANKIAGTIFVVFGMLCLVISMLVIRITYLVPFEFFSWLLYILSFCQIAIGAVMLWNAEPL